MSQGPSNIVLIGMPGAGKSTIGVLLAKQTARDFVDTDLLIQRAEECTLQSILDRDGYLALRAIEERVLLNLDVHHHVIATGGSAAYSEAAMEHLKKNAIVVFLQVDAQTLRNRIHDYESRGIARRPDQSFAELFAERHALYTRYADLTVDCAALSAEETVQAILRGLEATKIGTLRAALKDGEKSGFAEYEHNALVAELDKENH